MVNQNTLLSPAIFAQRRRRLMEQMGPNSIALLPAATPMLRSRDIYYPYHQDSDFYYLTGFPEPEAIAILMPGSEKEFLLFCRECDPQIEVWHGRRAGTRGAIEHYGVDSAYPIVEINRIVPFLLESCDKIFINFNKKDNLSNRIIDWLNQPLGKTRFSARSLPVTFFELEHLLHSMRLFKEPEEVEIMRESSRISAEAHCQAMRACRPGMFEYQLEAEILYTFMRNGAGWSYPSIIGSGDNSCILHYTENNDQLYDGDIVLVDAGAELYGYASDITRTFPANGKFSGEQRAIYELVLASQKAAIEKVYPGCRVNEPHEAAVHTLTDGLVALGFLHGDVEALIKEEQYKNLYMHSTGHWIGMDVHDVGNYKTSKDCWRLFEPGMITTIEPGIYIPAGGRIMDANWARLGVYLEAELEERWWRIGIRIEDNILVTADGHQILTEAVPKEIKDIEELMKDKALPLMSGGAKKSYYHGPSLDYGL